VSDHLEVPLLGSLWEIGVLSRGNGRTHQNWALSKFILSGAEQRAINTFLDLTTQKKQNGLSWKKP